MRTSSLHPLMVKDNFGGAILYFLADICEFK